MPAVYATLSFYNVELIKIACGKNKLATGFVDDCTFVAVVDSLEEVHTIIKDMMERPNGGLDWSQGHNLQFKISKLAVMDFPYPHKAELPTSRWHHYPKCHCTHSNLQILRGHLQSQTHLVCTHSQSHR